ncbi:MAG: AAA family ATPase [Mycobacteriales bacterium]|jgi:predicted kinase
MSTRLIILVSGAPAAGKTTLAIGLAAALRLPLICKDDIKETLVDTLGGPAGDLTWSRRIGGAAMEVLWRLAERCPAAVIEANFRPHNEYEHSRLLQLQARIIEIHCVCPTDELARRFAARAPTAHAAHPLTELSTELVAEYDQPIGLGEVINIDTTRPVDLTQLTTRLASMIQPAGHGEDTAVKTHQH